MLSAARWPQVRLSDAGTLAHRHSGLLAEVAYLTAIFRSALAADDPEYLTTLSPLVWQVDRPRQAPAAGAGGNDAADAAAPAQGGGAGAGQGTGQAPAAQPRPVHADGGAQVGAGADAVPAAAPADTGGEAGSGRAAAAAAAPRSYASILDRISLDPDLTPLLTSAMGGMAPMLVTQGGMPAMPAMGMLSGALQGTPGRSSARTAEGGSAQAASVRHCALAACPCACP